jgi:hypothetical protein
MSFKSITLPKFSLLPKFIKDRRFEAKNRAFVDHHMAVDTENRIARLEKQLKQMQNLVYSQEIQQAQK